MIDTPNPDKLPPVWVRAASEALQTRSRPDLAWKRNELRKGIDAIGQHYAVPHLAPLMGECRSRQQRNAIVRAAAIAAINDHCPQKDARAVKGQGFVAPYRLGHALRLLTRQRTGNFPSTLPAKRDSVARRLTLLPEMDFDSAVETVSALVSFANTERISINFFDLAKMLFLWGDGLTDNSIDIRNQVLSDYYGAAEAPRKAS